MIEAISIIFAILIVLTMGGMCFDWIGSGMVDPIYRDDSPTTTTASSPKTQEVSTE